MSTTPTEKTRKWRRQLAFIYWALSPLIFPIVVRLLLVPGLLVAALFEQPPAWLTWLAVPYLIGTCACAAAFLWVLWVRIRELPPPIEPSPRGGP